MTEKNKFMVSRAPASGPPRAPLPGARFLVVEARYYDDLADELLRGAREAIVAGESARALMDLSVGRRLPLGNGILTVENAEQAWTRARVSELNKGGGAVEAALSVLRLKRQAECPQR